MPGILLYALFSLYWSIAAKNAAPTQSSESKWSRAFHQILWNGAFVLILIPVPGLLRRVLPGSWLIVAFGLTLQAGGTLLAVWARLHLGRNWGGAVRIAVDHQLVRTGSYRFLRHPIYTGVLGMFFGLAIAAGRLHALLGLAIISLAYWRKIRMEEQILQDTFGAEFDAYRRDSWALIPMLF